MTDVGFNFGENLCGEDEEKAWLAENLVHYVASDKQLGEEVGLATHKVLSAGHKEHEWTTGTSWPHIQRFFGL